MRRVTHLFCAMALSALLGGAAAGCSPTAASVCKDACEQYEECNAADFQNQYASQADCRADCEAEYASIRSQSTEACYDAFLDASDCAANLSCSELVSWYNGGPYCRDENAEYERVCGVQ